MRVCDAVAATRAMGSARLEVAARLGGPSIEEEDLRGRGVVDFRSDRLLISEQLVTESIRQRGGQGVIARTINRPLLAIMNRAVGHEAFYEGGARWVLRGGRWKGPQGNILSAKNTWHPLFLLDMIEADERPLGKGRPDLDGGDVDVSRYELRVDGGAVPPAVREQWLLGQPSESGKDGAQSHYPRFVLYVGDEGVLHGFAHESVLGESHEGSLWKTVRLTDFGTSPAELGRIRNQI